MAQATKKRSTRRAQSGEGRIRPRARLLNSIGAELISSEIVAVIELVRNSYDADASRVTITFTGLRGGQEPSLVIEDNGHGMTREILLGPWMEPATDFKAGSASGELGGQRSPGGRRRLGSKGVGRFASQRLGTRLDLTTRTASVASRLVAEFDWSLIEEPGTYLEDMRIPWREKRCPKSDPSGTRLAISGLRDAWSPERFEKLRVALSRLVSPDRVGNPFEITLSIEGSSETIGSLIESTVPMYSLVGQVDENGQATITWLDLQGNREEWVREVLWPEGSERNCGPFQFRFSAWDLDRPALLQYFSLTGSKLGLRDFRRSLRDHTGVSLYRDGFRILPYGEPDNDWLRLDRRRVNNPTLRLSNNQLIGVILLGADENAELRDQTNREGLVANAAYEHLREVVCELVGYLENRRFSSRRAGDLGVERGGSRLPNPTGEADERLDELISGLDSGRRGASEIREALEARRQAEADTLRMYSGLAIAGQMSGLLLTQLTHLARRIDSELRLMKGDLSFEELDRGAVEDLGESVRRLESMQHELYSRLETLDPLVQAKRSRRVKRVRLSEALDGPLQAFRDLYAEAEVTLSVNWDKKVHGSKGPRVQTNPDVLQQALGPVLESALHWVQERAKGRRVTIELKSNSLSVINNGPPVLAADVPHLFDAHFTRRQDRPGMGLFLSRSLIATVGGSLSYAENRKRPEFTVRFG